MDEKEHKFRFSSKDEYINALVGICHELTPEREQEYEQLADEYMKFLERENA